MKPLSRRAVLRGAGVSIALPWMEAMAVGRKAYAAPAPRIIFFNTMNGTIKPNWTPKGSDTSFTLSPILSPLEKHKAKLVVIEGLDNQAATSGAGDDHMRGMGSMLTGIENAAGPTGGGISLDQHIAKSVGNGTKLASIHAGVNVALFGSVLCYTSYTGRGAPVPAENNPTNIFDRAFKDFVAPSQMPSGPDPKLEALRLKRKSILDTVSSQYTRMLTKLGQADREKLDRHLNQIRDVETRLTAMPAGGNVGVSSACKKPDAPAKGDARAVGKSQMDLIVMAMRCGLTRVANIQWDTSAGNSIRYSWLNISRGHHDISHDPDSNGTSLQQLTDINNWLASQMAYLLDQLEATPEGDGTMLDNTVVVWLNELTKGNVHSHPDMPVVLGGGKNLGIKTGRFLTFGKEPHNKLLVSLMNAMGVQGTTFGNGALGTGPLVGLT